MYEPGHAHYLLKAEFRLACQAGLARPAWQNWPDQASFTRPALPNRPGLARPSHTWPGLASPPTPHSQNPCEKLKKWKKLLGHPLPRKSAIFSILIFFCVFFYTQKITRRTRITRDRMNKSPGRKLVWAFSPDCQGTVLAPKRAPGKPDSKIVLKKKKFVPAICSPGLE